MHVTFDDVWLLNLGAPCVTASPACLGPYLNRTRLGGQSQVCNSQLAIIWKKGALQCASAEAERRILRRTAGCVIPCMKVQNFTPIQML